MTSSVVEAGIGARLAVLLGLLVLGPGVTQAAVPGEPLPNIVLILIDDLGWADPGVYGSAFHETPNIDRLAAGGLRFTNAYAAAPVCSPTRASLLTGKSPARLRITNFIPGSGAPDGSAVLPPRDWVKALPPAEETLAERLKRAGYVTGMIGKWHLGDPAPLGQGFDEDHSDGFWAWVRYWIPPILFDRYFGEYYPDVLSRKAVDFIDRHASGPRPFFLFLSHNTVHVPLQAKPEKIAKYEAKRERGGPDPEAQQNPVYAAMVESMDESVGRVMDALERLGIADRTLLVFGSDNGGLTVAEPLFSGHFDHTPATTPAPLRAGKGYLYEGGLRVPWIVRLPGVTRPGVVSDEPVITHDWFPTLAEIAGVPALDSSIEGRSLLPLLRDASRSLDRDALFFHYPHYSNQGGRPGGAVRTGRWKLIERYENGALELYDLESDLGERKDLAAQRPELAAGLVRPALRGGGAAGRVAAPRHSLHLRLPKSARLRRRTPLTALDSSALLPSLRRASSRDGGGGDPGDAAHLRCERRGRRRGRHPVSHRGGRGRRLLASRGGGVLRGCGGRGPHAGSDHPRAELRVARHRTGRDRRRPGASRWPILDRGGRRDPDALRRVVSEPALTPDGCRGGEEGGADMKVIVTGATGFLGRNLTESLQDDGLQVVATGRSPVAAEALRRRGIEFRGADILDRDALIQAFSPADCVVHCAGKSGPWGRFRDHYRANVVGTRNVIDACKTHDIGRIVFRPRALYGPYDTIFVPRILRMAEKGRVPLINDGRALVDITCTGNFVDAVRSSLTAPDDAWNQAYNICNGDPITVRDWFSQILRIFDRPFEPKSVPESVARVTATVLEFISLLPFTKDEPSMTRSSVEYLAKSMTMSIDKASAKLGCSPRLTNQQGFERYAEWYHSEGAGTS